MVEEKEKLVGKQAIAKLFGLSTRRIEQLQAEGIIHGEGKPIKFEFYTTVNKYIQFLSDKANGREKKEKDSKAESEKLDAEARIKKAKAEVAELELKELRGKLHRAEDVEAIVTDSALLMRSMLLALPGKLAVDLASIDNAAEIADRIKKEVYFILNRLADYEYDAEAYAERIRAREGWNERQDESD